MAVVCSCQGLSEVISKTLIMTHDGSGLSLVELLLQARDTESNIKKIDCVAGPGKPSKARICFDEQNQDMEVSTYPVKNCAHWVPVSESRTSKSGLCFASRA